jgi:phage terminase large subunit
MTRGLRRLRRRASQSLSSLAEHLGLANINVVPDLGVQDGIQAVRMTLPKVWFDELKCAEGIEALRQYEREYDEDKKAFRAAPKHNWCSHPADAFRMLAVAWRGEVPRRSWRVSVH